jgi:hypothetical protein
VPLVGVLCGLAETRSFGASPRKFDAVAGAPACDATRSVERGERITQQLLAFARKQTLLPKAVDLDQILGGMSDLLQTTVGTMIGVETRV